MTERLSHYEITRRLGRGGMGEVYEATDTDLGRRVALKFVAPAFAGDPESLRRFEREARAAAALHHPRIATLFAFDRSTDRPFLAMELLEGPTLRDALQAGPLPVPQALAIARDVAGALAYAHRHGVVHRDIKPENLMFDADGAIKITDFGLARTADASRLTTTGSTLGTAAYMAPELLSGAAGSGAIDIPGEGGAPSPAPADVFALGVTLFEMLSGETPFRAETALATMYAIANRQPRPLRDACPEAPEAVERLVARMIDKDPVARPTAGAVAIELGERTGVPVTVPTPPVPFARSADSGQITVPFGAAGPASGAPVTRGRLPRWLPWIALAAVVSAGAFGVRPLLPVGGAAHDRAVSLNNEGLDSLNANRPDAARRRFEDALALDPHFTQAKLNLALTLHAEGDDNRAAALFGQVISAAKREPANTATAHYMLGEMDLESHAWPSAIAHFTAAARLDTTRADYVNNLGFALLQAGRSDEAITTLRAARVRFPGTPNLLKNSALAWLLAGRADSAAVAATEAVRLRPMYPEAWSLKVRSEAALGNLAAARSSLEMLRRLPPDSLAIAEAELALRAAEARPPHPPQPAAPPAH